MDNIIDWDMDELAESIGGFGLQTVATPMPPVTVEKYPDVHLLSKARRWAVRDGVYHGASDSTNTLPPGIYKCGFDDRTGAHMMLQTIQTDEILELPDGATSSLIKEFECFWAREKEFRDRGFLMKRGFLLWGPPGSGKTQATNLLCKKISKNHNGVVLLADSPGLYSLAIRLVRKIEPKRRIVGVMEDIDALVDRYGENEFLSVLDGESQVDNIVTVATTNYPERLDQRFVDRPSRFDTLKYIGMPSKEARRVYLNAKEKSLHGEELDEWVRLSEGFSIAHLKEMIIAVKCLGQTLREVVNRLEEMHERKPTSEDSPDKSAFGFRRAA